MMRRMVSLIVIVSWIITGSLPAIAGEHKDYFTAGQDQSSNTYLQLTERHHLDKVLGLIRIEDYRYAIRQIEWTLNIFSNHPRALMLIETVATLTKVPELPLPYYQAALDDHPQYALTHAQYGRYLAETANLSEGLAQLRRAIALDPDLPAPHVWLAEIYVRSGKPELAAKEVRSAKALG